MKVGDRVQLHPATDAWMQGDRYGEIVRITNTSAKRGRKLVHVKCDSGRERAYIPRYILEIVT